MVHLFPVTLPVYYFKSTQTLTMLGQFLQVLVNVFVFLFTELKQRTSCHQKVLLIGLYVFTRI